MSIITFKNTCVGIVSSDLLQQIRWREALLLSGYEVRVIQPPIGPNITEGIAILLIDFSDPDHIEDLLTQLDSVVLPILYSDEKAPNSLENDFDDWRRRLTQKLEKTIGPPLVNIPVTPAVYRDRMLKSWEVFHPKLTKQTLASTAFPWTLIASTGGIQAVIAFLKALPCELPVGFFYAQHTQIEQSENLSHILSKHVNWKVGHTRHNDWLRKGEVLIVPHEHQLGFFGDGRMKHDAKPWTEPYAPSLNELLFNLRVFGNQNGVIVFSGMDNDGADQAEAFHKQGGILWTQSESSCVCASMPKSMEKYAQFQGSPEELAVAMKNLLEKQLQKRATLEVSP